MSIRPLGTGAIVNGGSCGPVTSVPASRCLTCQVTQCPGGVADINASLKVTDPSVALAGTVVLIAGGGGTGLYEAAFPNAAASVILPAVARGQRVIQVAWASSPFTGTQGPLALMVRAATMLKAIYDDASLRQPGLPFAASGNSGGSSQLAYALEHYGAGAWIDMAVLTSGPPHGRVDFGAMGALKPSWAALGPTLRTTGAGIIDYAGDAAFVDSSFGGTACQSRALDGGPSNPGQANSVDNGSAELRHPDTDLYFLYGAIDGSGAVPLGRYYAQQVEDAAIEVVAGSDHFLPNSANGGVRIDELLSSAVFLH
jgi:hypothetical protein